MSSIEIHYCLKCGRKFYTRDPSMLYCNEGCKWDSENDVDCKKLGKYSPKMVVNKFGELEAIEINEGVNEMGKKVIINTTGKTVKQEDLKETIKSFISDEPKNDNGLNFVYDRLESLKTKKAQLETDLQVIAEQVETLEKAYEILNN